ncbi:Gfo/Idh/MocA family protein [Bythopirellula goksoeyrii]|uniref:Glucose--fructose oxidoreductase n=1 Tax=Bythopirellula goksoeyrii TaxID=1400387 RepID=A0A5B9QF86_9BACT|nr:Gfo/Idh/MocA family oxidoreductase [Bythopirellula goksoeyrii]QEG36285.1 Glucose--fructose oxidoreductase precursor [Bythopirellula goksoeyrii]
MIRVGIVGVGFMGMVHYLTYLKLLGIEVVAICDSNRDRLNGDWSEIQGNFGPVGQKMDLTGILTYESAEELIAEANVDLIDITLPPAMHAEIAIKALQAGRHVFCEKPMAMDVGDCDRMLQAAIDSDRKLLIGHVLPFNPEYAWALQEVHSGKYGKILSGSFKRIISDPSWLTDYWKADVVGGPMLDLHVHDAHFIRLLFGMPSRVTTRGSQRNGLAEHWSSLFEFSDGTVHVLATSGVINQQGRPFLHGFEIQMEKATLAFDFAVIDSGIGEEQGRYLCKPILLDSRGHATYPSLGNGDPMHAFAAELEHVSKVIPGELTAGVLACDLARDAIQICQMQSDNLAFP